MDQSGGLHRSKKKRKLLDARVAAELRNSERRGADACSSGSMSSSSRATTAAVGRSYSSAKSGSSHGFIENRAVFLQENGPAEEVAVSCSKASTAAGQSQSPYPTSRQQQKQPQQPTMQKLHQEHQQQKGKHKQQLQHGEKQQCGAPLRKRRDFSSRSLRDTGEEGEQSAAQQQTEKQRQQQNRKVEAGGLQQQQQQQQKLRKQQRQQLEERQQEPRRWHQGHHQKPWEQQQQQQQSTTKKKQRQQGTAAWEPEQQGERSAKEEQAGATEEERDEKKAACGSQKKETAATRLPHLTLPLVADLIAAAAADGSGRHRCYSADGDGDGGGQKKEVQTTSKDSQQTRGISSSSISEGPSRRNEGRDNFYAEAESRGSSSNSSRGREGSSGKAEKKSSTSSSNSEGTRDGKRRSSSSRRSDSFAEGGGTVGLAEVSTLEAKGRGIEEVDDLSACKQLRRLDISENSLKSLLFLEFNLEVRWLKAARNAISGGEKLRQALRNLQNLIVLDLGENQIQRLEDFSVLKNLKTLVLSHNRIRHVPFSTFAPPSLECLILSHNQIETVEKPAQPLPHLKKLSLSSNRLKSFPFCSLFPELKELRLHGNVLLNVGTGVICMPSLNILDLSKNQIHRMQGVQALAGHLKLTQLNLLGNPLLSADSSPEEEQKQHQMLQQQLLSKLPALKIYNTRLLVPRPIHHRKQLWKQQQQQQGHQ